MSDQEKAPKVTIKGTRQRRTEPKAKPKYSNWLLTINSNQSYKEDDPHRESDAEIMEEAVVDILNNIKSYIRIEDENGSWSSTSINSVEVDYGVEYGPKQRRLHCHIFVRVKHNTKVKLDYQGIKKAYCDALGLDNCYFDSKLIRTSSEQWVTQYISKLG